MKKEINVLKGKKIRIVYLKFLQVFYVKLCKKLHTPLKIS